MVLKPWEWKLNSSRSESLNAKDKLIYTFNWFRGNIKPYPNNSCKKNKIETIHNFPSLTVVLYRIKCFKVFDRKHVITCYQHFNLQWSHCF